MSKKGNATNQDGGVDPNAWMATFGDLVMLLLTFFVLLLTMSSMDQKVLKDLFSHLTESTGVLGFSGSRQMDFDAFVKSYSESDTKIVLDHKVLKDMYELSIKFDSKMKTFEGSINISDDERGLVLSFQEYVLFGPGEVELKQEAFEVLDSITTSIESCGNDILIMGHTDSVPVNSPLYESNWELSLYRGLSVTAYFIEGKKIPASRFYVGGYGDTRPLYRNDTPEHRTKNRRVEIIFKRLREE